MTRSISLSTRMSCAASLLVAAILLVLAFFAQFAFEGYLKENISRQQFTMISALAEQVDDRIIAARENLALVAGAISPEVARDPAREQSFLQERLASRLVFDGGLFVFSPEGAMLAGTAAEPRMQASDLLLFRDFLKSAGTAGKSAVPPPFFFTEQGGHPTVLFCAPISDQRGFVTAILVGGIDLLKQNFLGKLATVRIARGGYLFLYNTSRMLIVHPERSRMLQRDVPPGANRLFDQAIAGFEGTGATVNSRGLHAISSFKHLKSTDWILAANYPEAEAYEPVYRAKRYFLSALAAAVCLTVFIVWWFMHRLAAPLRSFTEHVELIASSEVLLHPIRIVRRDEIGVLTEAFNLMQKRVVAQRMALKDEKEFSESLVQNSAVPIFVLDSEHRVMIWNKACEKLTGIPAKEVIGSSNHSQIFYPDRYPCLADIIIDGATAEGSTHYHYHFQSTTIPEGIEAEGAFRDTKGNEHNIFITAAPIRNARGELIAAIESVQDITELKRIEARLRHAQKMEAIGTLAGGVAHDFNTILTAISGYGHLMRTETDLNSTLARKCLDEVLSGAERGTALTRSLLTFSRHEVSNLALIGLSQVVKGLERFLSTLAGETVGLTVTYPGQEQWVEADKAQIEQILMNLVTNARDAMDNEGRVAIRIAPVDLDHEYARSQGLSRGGSHVLLSVSDSGAGMDKATVERIFEPFFTTKETGKGTGLGLAIVYDIVRQLKGCIAVASNPGAGTTFEIYFPTAQSCRPDEARDDSARRASETGTGPAVST